jgi:transposase
MFFREAQIRVQVHGRPADLRQSFDGLIALTRSALREDPVSGQLFVFFNRRSTLVKVLYWDRSGFCVWAKRLEAGRFIRDWSKASTRETDWTGLKHLLEGIEPGRTRKRYHLSSKDESSPLLRPFQPRRRRDLEPAERPRSRRCLPGMGEDRRRPAPGNRRTQAADRLVQATALRPEERTPHRHRQPRPDELGRMARRAGSAGSQRPSRRRPYPQSAQPAQRRRVRILLRRDPRADRGRRTVCTGNPWPLARGLRDHPSQGELPSGAAAGELRRDQVSAVRGEDQGQARCSSARRRRATSSTAAGRT